MAITAAPIAAAASAPAPHGACDAGVSGSICDTPGDVGSNDSLSPVSSTTGGGPMTTLLIVVTVLSVLAWIVHRRPTPQCDRRPLAHALGCEACRQARGKGR